MKTLKLIVLVLFGFVLTQAQVYRVETILKSASNLNYFALANSAGDSTNTLGLDVTTKVTIGTQIFSLYPDSMKLVYHTNSDSIYSVNVYSKKRANTALGYVRTFVDSIYSTTAAVKEGEISIPRTHFSQATQSNFGIAFLANTLRNATATANATDVYVVLVKFYTLPK